jgi:2-oxoglutarate ferredoxin oxidoreductase subunit alpha
LIVIKNMKLNIVFGGEAGQGPNFLTHLLGSALVQLGYFVFYSRDYQSLIRGGHNFNILTFSEKPVHSNVSEIDILVCLDANTEMIHKKNLKKEGIILKGHKENTYYAGKLFKILGLDFNVLDGLLKKEKRYEENIKFAKQGYEDTKENIQIPKSLEKNPKKNYFMNGNQGISKGAIKAGLDIYYAYPMTPATPVMGELAENQIDDNIIVLELENEIGVINAAVGSAMTGAKAMVGTSGGGFDLMTETLSLTGIAEVPMVIYLAQRAGAATGVATYTGQGDLNIARHAGHGGFSRLVLAPGDPKEAQELTSQSFYFSQKYKVPVILIGDKHLAESCYTLNEMPKITSSSKSTELIRYNSYEKDKFGSATENPEIVNENVERRLRKGEEIVKEAEKFDMIRVHGKDSNNVVVSWGSPKGAILDSIDGLNCKFLQILYMEPFSSKIKKELEGKNIILVENNATGPLANLITEKTGIFIEDKNKILRYDGRPFLADELKKEIERRLV